MQVRIRTGQRPEEALKPGSCIGVSRASRIGHNGARGNGKRAAPRHSGAARLEEFPAAGSRSGNGPLLLLALGITAAVVAWGYLVYLAIDFGTSARNGDAKGWAPLGLATVGAIACLFVALMLVTRCSPGSRPELTPPGPPRPPGGRRAAR